MQPAIGKLVTELGLANFAQQGESDVLFERMSREAPHRLPGMRQEPQSIRLAGGSAALVRALARELPADAIRSTRHGHVRLTEGSVELSIRRSNGEDLIRAEHVIAALPPRLLEAAVQFEQAQEPETLTRWRTDLDGAARQVLCDLRPSLL